MKIRTEQKLLTALLAAVLITGCGGGGSSDDAENTGADTNTSTGSNTGSNSGSNTGNGNGSAAAGVLSKYLGKYEYCDDGEKAQMTITQENATTLQVDAKSDFYAQSNCQGAIVGSLISSTPFKIFYHSTDNQAPVLSIDEKTTTKQDVDRVTFYAPANTTQLIGNNITVIDGESCIPYAGGDFCLDTTEEKITGGLLLTNAQLLFLEPQGDRYEIFGVYQR